MKKLLLVISLLAGTSSALLAQSEAKNIPEYGKNIIRFAPLKLYDQYVGMGLSYERVLDKEQKVSFILPIDLTFVNNYDFNGNMYSNNRVTNYFYISPGVKFYPSGQRKVNYAIGANMLFGFGKYNYFTGYYNNMGQWVGQNELLNNFRFGMIVNNYLNFNIAKNFTIGIELGLGAIYINHLDKVNIYNGIEACGNVGFTMGFRF